MNTGTLRVTVRLCIFLAMGMLGAPVTHGAGPIKFKPPVYYAVGAEPNNVVAADFNGDGNLDLATATWNAQDVSVLLNAGQGTFGSASHFASYGTLGQLLLGDFNTDTKLDLVAINSSHPSASLDFFAGNGDGTFAPRLEQAEGLMLFGGAAADFDNDGKLDVASIRYTTNKLSLFHGNGDGTFGREVQFEVPVYSYMVAAGDLNGDARPDLVVATGYQGANLAIILSSGASGYTETNYPISGAHNVTIADLNRDGIQDLLVPGGELRVLQGIGNGTFFEKRRYPLGRESLALAVADFNRDGRLDVVASNFRGTELALYRGWGKGKLRGPIEIPVGRLTRSVTAADVNGDGAPDIVASAASPSSEDLGAEVMVLFTESKRKR